MIDHSACVVYLDTRVCGRLLDCVRAKKKNETRRHEKESRKNETDYLMHNLYLAQSKPSAVGIIVLLSEENRSISTQAVIVDEFSQTQRVRPCYRHRGYYYVVAAPPTHPHARSSERFRKEKNGRHIYGRLHLAYDVERTVTFRGD